MDIVPCPCCKEALYQTKSNEDGLRFGMPPPKINERDGQDWTECPHCHKQIRMDRFYFLPGGPLQFRVSAAQECGEK